METKENEEPMSIFYNYFISLLFTTGWHNRQATDHGNNNGKIGSSKIGRQQAVAKYNKWRNRRTNSNVAVPSVI